MSIGIAASKKSSLRFLTGGILLFAVLLLPFHSHPTASTAQLERECACLHGVRSEVGTPPSSVSWTPNFQEFSLALRDSELLERFLLSIPSIRAPPVLAA